MNRALLAVLVTAFVISGCDKPVPLPTEPLSLAKVGRANDVFLENTYQSTDIPKVIPDNGTTNSTLEVPANGFVNKVTVRFNITHPFDQDLIISLVSPAGTIVTLVNRRGSSEDNFSNTTLDDNAAIAIAAGSPPFSATYTPDQALATFGGESAQGTWTLRVQDVSVSDQGTLNDWSLTIITSDVPPTVGTVSTFESTNVPTAIVDNQIVSSTVQVPDIGTIAKVTVRLNIVHTFDSDLRISLTGPGGVIVRQLVNRRGSSGDNFTNTTFDDNASLAIASGAAPFAGTFRPEQPLAGFIGSSSQGTWTLAVQDLAGGDVGQLTAWSLSITPTNVPPIAAAGADQTEMRTSAAGAEIKLETTGSSDSDGSITLFEWLENGAPIATGATAQHVFTLGTHVVTLRVTDDDGARGEDEVVITIENASPTAAAGADQTAARSSSAGLNVTLNAAGSSDSDGTIEYEWFENDQSIASGANAQHVFALGRHVVTLRVTDNDGGQDEDQVVITVENSLPTAAAGDDQQLKRTSFGGADVTLDGSKSGDSDGTISTYEWLENGSPIASGAVAQHVFPLGMHVVTLRVTDNDGGQAEDQVAIMIGNVPPTVTVNPPFTLQCRAGGATANFLANGADTDGFVTYAWSPTGATTAAMSFFAPLGTTQVGVTVTDDDGAFVQASSSVTVLDTQQPVISMVVRPTTLLTNNKEMVKVASGISASDGCDSSPRLTVLVSSNEPKNTKGNGNNNQDWNVVRNANGTYDVYVRAERNGNGKGRIYTITARATDGSGNTSSLSRTVTVPHDGRKTRTGF
jgi:subtilisin-like proprotein convertase family protein